MSGPPSSALRLLRPQVLRLLTPTEPGLAVADVHAFFAGEWAPGTVRIVLETLERDGLAVSDVVKGGHRRLTRHYRRGGDQQVSP